MDSNKQNELTCKVETDSQREQADSCQGGRLSRWGVEGIQQKKENTHGRGQQCCD